MENNKIADLIVNGTITVEELSKADELIKLAQYTVEAVEACKKTIVFHVGETEIACIDYWDTAGEAHFWGKCKNDGTFTGYTNWGGDHALGTCNLTKFNDVFISLERGEMRYCLRTFLDQQIEKTKNTAN